MDFVGYLPGQRRWFKWEKFKVSIIAVIIGYIIGTGVGFMWCVKVNVAPLRIEMSKKDALISELKKGYVPLRTEPPRVRVK